MIRRQVAVGLLGALAMVLVLTTMYTLVKTTTVVELIRQDQKAGQQRSKDTKANTDAIRRIAEQIESCTSPEGDCFKRGQERTGQAVASINDVIIAAAACDKGDTPLAQIQDCVEDLLRVPPQDE